MSTLNLPNVVAVFIMSRIWSPHRSAVRCNWCNTALMLRFNPHCELSNNSVINASAPCFHETLLSCLHYKLHTSHCCHWCITALMLRFNPHCLITQLSIHLHPVFTKFCCRLHYKSLTASQCWAQDQSLELHYDYKSLTASQCWAQVQSLELHYVSIRTVQ
jgi:hypothetical protein